MYAHILKTSEGAKKAWLSRERSNPSREQVASLGEKFLKEFSDADAEKHWGDVTVEEACTQSGLCSMVSETLSNYLNGLGYHTDTVTGQYQKDKERAKHARTVANEGEWDGDGHTVVQIGNYTLDVTARQFDLKLPRVRVLSLDQFASEWGQTSIKKGQSAMYAHILKDSEASKKAWLKRTRAIHYGGKGVGWTGVDGKPLGAAEQAQLKRIKGGIPPAWSKVFLSTDPNASLIATGFDAKGRPQSKYSVEHTDAAAIAKFVRVRALHDKIPKLMSDTKKEMLALGSDERTRENAAMIYLVAKTGFRPGSNKDTGADEQSFGASTLEKRHVKVDKTTITFDFIGKSGVHQIKKVTDQALAMHLSGRLKSIGDNDKVFSTTAESALRYLKKKVGNQFKIKDLRTWNGSAVARALVDREEMPANEKALKDQQKRISTLVSSHLGNTPAVALKDYIDPLIWKHAGMFNAKKA